MNAIGTKIKNSAVLVILLSVLPVGCIAGSPDGVIAVPDSLVRSCSSLKEVEVEEEPICVLYGIGEFEQNTQAALKLIRAQELKGVRRYAMFKFFVYRGDFGAEFTNDCAAFEVTSQMYESDDERATGLLADFYEYGVCVEQDLPVAMMLSIAALSNPVLQSESDLFQERVDRLVSKLKKRQENDASLSFP